ncbi:DUF1029 domain protein, partial [Monkeypox virus]
MISNYEPLLLLVITCCVL